MTEILQINPRAPEQELIDKAVEHLKNGEVIAYPTETIYGLGANVFNSKAIKKIYELKSRDYGLPISILVSDIEMLKSVTDEVPKEVLPLIRRFWPGALTICFPANKAIPKDLITNTGKVGIRISSHPIASAIVRTLGKPVTTTSANPSGFPPSLDVKHIVSYFKDRIPCIVDGGECEPSRGSTVIDIGEESMRIIRDGSIPADEVIDVFRQRK